jgi:hypothetical protein
MAYSKFIDLKKTVQQFELQAERAKLFPSEVTVITPSSWLKETIAIAFDILGVDSEKERSERLVHPILTEMAVINKGEITIYSGHELNVDKNLGLNGECDYMLSLGRKVIDYIDAPIFSIVEAKKQNFELGTSQSVAQLVGAQRFNEKEGKSLSLLFGAATDGVKWRFFKLEGKKLSIDTDYYTIENIPKLLGVLQYIIDNCRLNK